MSDKLADGRSFRILTVVDQFTRECVCLEANRAMTGMKVAQALQRAKVERGSLPSSITVDNGSEFCSRTLAKFREHYNQERPHSALADRTPTAFAELHRGVTGKNGTSMGRNPCQIW